MWCVVSEVYYKRVTKMLVLEGCYKGVASVLQECNEGVSRVLSYVTRMLQRCYKNVTDMSQVLTSAPRCRLFSEPDGRSRETCGGAMLCYASTACVILQGERE